MCEIYYDDVGYIGGAVGLDGKPVSRTKDEHPYSYDPFVTWQDESYVRGEGYKTIYSDRLRGWDRDKYSSCCKEIWGEDGHYFYDREPRDIERFLTLRLDKPIKLVLLAEGCNCSDGSPHWIFVYKELEEGK